MTSFVGWGGAWGDSWGPLTVDPNAMAGSANFAFLATGTLSAIGDGFMSGAASFAVSATGNLTATSSIIETIFGGGGSRRALTWADIAEEEAEHAEEEATKRRIKRQNEMVLAVVIAAVTQGCL